VGHRSGPGKFFTVPVSDKKKLCKLCGIFTGKIFKIYFGNVFSMENDFLDHATFTKFFSDPVKEP